MIYASKYVSNFYENRHGAHFLASYQMGRKFQLLFNSLLKKNNVKITILLSAGREVLTEIFQTLQIEEQNKENYLHIVDKLDKKDNLY